MIDGFEETVTNKKKQVTNPAFVNISGFCTPAKRYLRGNPDKLGKISPVRQLTYFVGTKTTKAV